MPRQAKLDAPGTLRHLTIRKTKKHLIVYDEEDRQNTVFRSGTLAEETQNQNLCLIVNDGARLLSRNPSGEGNTIIRGTHLRHIEDPVMMQCRK